MDIPAQSAIQGLLRYCGLYLRKERVHQRDGRFSRSSWGIRAHHNLNRGNRLPRTGWYGGTGVSKAGGPYTPFDVAIHRASRVVVQQIVHPDWSRINSLACPPSTSSMCGWNSAGTTSADADLYFDSRELLGSPLTGARSRRVPDAKPAAVEPQRSHTLPYQAREQPSTTPRAQHRGDGGVLTFHQSHAYLPPFHTGGVRQDFLFRHSPGHSSLVQSISHTSRGSLIESGASTSLALPTIAAPSGS